MNKTIAYYDMHADEYFEQTCGVDFSDAYGRFLKYIPAGGSIVDLGCGSGRDTAWFTAHGYQAIGVDASEKMVELACERLHIQAQVARMEDWIAETPFDGIWCCASLLHLDDEALRSFFEHLAVNLKEGGALFISVKTGIRSGDDSLGRYMVDFSEQKLEGLHSYCKGLAIEEIWYTRDELGRDAFRWMNAILRRINRRR